MKFDALRGIWKAAPVVTEDPLPDCFPEEEENRPEPEEDPDYISGNPFKSKPLKGSCVLSIRFENRAKYLKWKKYNPDRQWEFLVNYPAMMRAEYSFSTAMEVENMAKKIVQLLSMGFDVYSASWKLEEKESELCGKTDELS